MKKRLLSFLSVIACLSLVFSMQMVSAASQEAEYEYTAEDFSFYTDPWIENWFSGNADTIKEYDSQYTAGGLSVEYAYNQEDCSEMIEKAGELVKYEDAVCTTTDGIITISKKADCKNRDIVFTFTYDMENGTVLWNAEMESTMGEAVAKAGLNTLMGMGTVFLVLIFISFVISLFGLFSKTGSKKNKKEEVKAEEPQVVTAQAAVSSDDEIIAVISAAIAAYEEEMAGSGLPADQLVVRSIKKRGFN